MTVARVSCASHHGAHSPMEQATVTIMERVGLVNGFNHGRENVGSVSFPKHCRHFELTLHSLPECFGLLMSPPLFALSISENASCFETGFVRSQNKCQTGL